MKIYLAHSTKFDFQKELYEPLKNSRLDRDYEINYFLEDDAINKVKNSKEVIRASDIVIAEISLQSTAIGIELGWADAFGKKIILIHHVDKPISKYMSLISTEILEYKNQNDLVTKLELVLD